ncbi:MAG TPA: hypothetical protein PLC65_00860 [Bacteroidia bacterium]|nr:hypothetical protein [Bacteroidia bacterium]
MYREYLIGKLAFPLVIGQKYYVSFKVNRADSLFVTGYSNNKIGVKFSVNKSGNVPINNIASYYSNTIINDTIGWTTIFGSFVSDSMYNFIMLGNFFDDLNTTYLSDFPGLGAYYYIDDVCVSTDSVFTIKYNTGINEFIDLNDIQVIPSNCNEYFYVNNIKTNSKIDVFDAIGRTCYTIFSVPDEVTRIDCSNWNNGFYYVRVNSFTKKNYS